VAGAFQLVGVLGIVVLLLSLFAGEIGDFGHPDADGPFSVPAIAALLGGVGFGGAAAAPLSAVDKMTVISADGAGSLGRSVAANVAQGLQLSGDLTGIDVAGLLRRLGGAANAGVTHVPVVVDVDTPTDGNGVRH
jgi:hypothetical protein